MNEDVKKNVLWYFPGGLVVKNPPCHAGNMGSIPGQGIKLPHATEKLSPWATTTELCTPELSGYNWRFCAPE